MSGPPLTSLIWTIVKRRDVRPNAARNARRPIRPNPLIPTRTDVFRAFAAFTALRRFVVEAQIPDLTESAPPAAVPKSARRADIRLSRHSSFSVRYASKAVILLKFALYMIERLARRDVTRPAKRSWFKSKSKRGRWQPEAIPNLAGRQAFGALFDQQTENFEPGFLGQGAQRRDRG